MIVDSELTGVTELKLREAILLYHNGSIEPDSMIDQKEPSQAIATIHQVMFPDENGGPVIGPGRAVTLERVSEIYGWLTNASIRREILSERILFADARRMAWFCPSERREIFFKTSDQRFNREVSGKTALFPSLVFCAEPGSLFVWAVDTIDRPVKDTVLHMAPFFNIYGSGLMCRGSARYPASLRISEIGEWERAFFETNFTHSNASSSLTTYRTGHNGLWRRLARWPRTKGFPYEYLRRMELNISNDGKSAYVRVASDPIVVTEESKTPAKKPQSTVRPYTVEEMLNFEKLNRY